MRMTVLNKGRLESFIDAILAIIMTILVLNLQMPKEPTLAGFWALRESFFAYALSFFWLGSLWTSMNGIWQNVQRINNITVTLSLVLLFFCSLFPYACSLANTYFYNRTVQGFYGSLILGVTILNLCLHTQLERINQDCPILLLFINEYRKLILVDLIIKVCGLISIAWFPPGMMIATLIALTWMKAGEFVLDRRAGQDPALADASCDVNEPALPKPMKSSGKDGQGNPE